MPVPRSSIVGAVAGVAVLAVFVGFTVGLPEVVEDDTADAAGHSGEAPDGTPVEDLLPDSVNEGRFVPLEEASNADAELVRGQEDFASRHLTELFGVDTASRTYTTEDQQALVSLTISNQEPGLFLPSGPPYDPELVGQRIARSELLEVGESICSVVWGSEEQYTQTGGRPLQVNCQQGAGGRTYDVFAVGITHEEAAALLDDVVAQSEAQGGEE